MLQFIWIFSLRKYSFRGGVFRIQRVKVYEEQGIQWFGDIFFILKKYGTYCPKYNKYEGHPIYRGNFLIM